MTARRLAQQRVRQSRIVENRVDPFVGEPRLDLDDLLPRLTSKNPCGELGVVARQAMTGVGENHLSSFSPVHTPLLGDSVHAGQQRRSSTYF